MNSKHTALLLLGLAFATSALTLGCDTTEPVRPEAFAKNQTQVSPQPEPPKPESLFDGETLDGWLATSYGGEGEVSVQDGSLVIGVGDMLSGVTTTREDYPTMDYEISLEAKKVSGIDFFCGLTFPYNESHCSLIVGGWAGTVVGFSCVDGKDASDNPTSISRKFEKNQWYKIKLRVESETLQVWIDDELVVTQETKDRLVAVRNDADPSCPLGFCSFQTEAHLRNIQLTRIASSPKSSPEK